MMKITMLDVLSNTFSSGLLCFLTAKVFPNFLVLPFWCVATFPGRENLCDTRFT